MADHANAVDGCTPVGAPAELTPAVLTLVQRARYLAIEAEQYDELAGQEVQRAERHRCEAARMHAERIDIERALAHLGAEGAAGLVELAK